MDFLRLLWAFLLLGATAAANGRVSLVYVGTDTTHGGQGIYAFRFDDQSGHLTPLGLAAETPRPSFLVVGPRQPVLYAVNEVDQFRDKATGSVSAFATSKLGPLTLLNQVSSHDAGPAHISLDRTAKFVFVSNYPNGSVAAFRVLRDGRIGEMTSFAQHHGSGPNRDRQESAHAHAVELSADNRFAVVADLGLDQIFVYPFDAAKGKFGEPQVLKSKPGSGPRHLVFSEDSKFVYVLNELSSTLTVFSYSGAKGSLSELQTISMLSKDFKGESFASEIALHPSGKFLYASNRGEDSIAVFSVDRAKGTLTPIENAPSGGKIPRHFAIDPSGEWMLVGNQLSDNIAIFHIDSNTGRLTETGNSVQIPKPVCLVFANP